MPARVNYDAARVNYDGYVDYYGSDVDFYAEVRPVVCLRLS
jgi:hypothetical protein